MRNRIGRFLVSCVSTYLFSAPWVTAQTSHVWDGGGTNGLWSSVTNWVGDVAPPNPTTNYMAFAGVTRLSNNADAAWTVFGLIISNGAGGFTLYGSPLTLTAASVAGTTNVFQHLGASNVVINNNIILPETLAPTNRRTMMISGAGGVTFNGSVSNSGPGLGDLHVRGTGSGAGTLAGGVWLGTNTLFHTDTATWIIAGTNNVWGRTELDQTGTVRIAANDALPTNTTVQFNTANPRLDLNNFSQTISALTGTGVVRTGTGAGGTLTISDLGASSTFQGQLAEGGRLVKRGSGTFTLAGGATANTYTGSTTVIEGVLLLAKNGSVNAIAAGDVTVQTGAVLRIGADSQISDGISNLVLNAGTLDVQTFIEGVSSKIRMTDAVLAGSGGSGLLLARGGYEATGTNLIAKRVSVRSTDASSGLFNIAGTTRVAGVIYTDTPGAQGITKAGPGVLELYAANSYTGTTTISAGTIALQSGGSLDRSTNIRVGAGATFDVTPISSISLQPGQSLSGDGTVLGDVIVDGSSRLLAGADGTPGTLTVSGAVAIGSFSYTNTFDLTNSLAVGGGTNDLLVVGSALIPNASPVRIRALAPLVSGTYRLIEYGGALLSSFDPNVQGDTYRDTWTLDTNTPGQVNLIVAAGTNFALTWQPQADGNWDLMTTLNWSNLVTSALGDYADNDSVVFDDSGAAFPTVTLQTNVRPAALVVNSSSNYAFNGPGGIEDSFLPLTLFKSGSGVLTIATSNRYSGGTMVSNGVVVHASAGALGSGPVSLAGGTMLEEISGGTIPGGLLGAGSLRKSAGGNLTLSGAGAFSGSIAISNGTLLTVAAPGFLSPGAFAGPIANDGQLIFNGSTQAVSSAITGTGSLLLTAPATNSGVLTLANSNSYAGTTFVNAGVMTLSSLNGPAVPGNIVADNNLSPDLYTTAGYQFGPGAVLTMTNNAGDHMRFDLLGTTQRLAGIQTAYVASKGIIENRDVGPAGAYSNALLILDGSGSYFYGGYLRDSQVIGSNRLDIAKLGSGTQTLWGTLIDYSGSTVVGGGSLVLTNLDDVHTLALTVSNGASTVIDTSARATFQFLKKATVSGGGSIIQLGPNSVWLGASGQGVTMAMDPGALIDVRAGLMRNEFGAFNNWTNNFASLGVSNGASFWVWDANTFVDALNGAGLIDKGQNSTHTLTVGTAGGSGVFDGVIRNTTGTLNFAKAGAGKQTLNANNTYTGTTTVAAGILALGASAGITGSTRIIVSPGAALDVSALGTLNLAGFQSLEGGGAVTGHVVTATGSRIVPGSVGATGTLSVSGNLSLGPTVTNLFEFSATDTTPGAGINDLVVVGGSLDPSNAVIALSYPAIASGTYRLFNYYGTKATSFNPALVGNTSRKSWTLDEATPGQINLVVSGSFLALKWKPQTSSNWDVNVGANWLDTSGLTNTVFMEADGVLFDDSGAATGGVNLVGAPKPGSVTVNSASNYTFSGPGRISGSTGLTKDGAGTLLVLTTNDFLGTVTVSGGVVSVMSDLHLGPVPAATSAVQVVLNGGALRVLTNLTIAATRGIAIGSAGGTLDSAPVPSTVSPNFSSVISGNGPLTLRANGDTSDTGGGTGGNMTIGGTNNTFVGDVTIVTGVVSFAGEGTFGAATNKIVLGGGGLVATIVRTINRQFVLAGGVESVFRTYGNQTFNVMSNVTGYGSIKRTDSGTNYFFGDLTHTGSFIQAAGTTWLLGTNTYTSGTVVRAGTLVVRELADSGPSGIANGGLLTFGGGTLRYDGAAQTATMREITNLNLSRTSIEVTNATASLLLGGTIGGTGGITKLGAGLLVISNNAVTSLQANPGLTVRGGTLLLAAGQVNSQNPANFSDYIGQNSGDVATMTLAAQSSFYRSNSILYVGDQAGAKGTFNIQDNATFYGNYRVSLGNNGGATGIINQTGGRFVLANDNYVANGGVGTYSHVAGIYSNSGGYTYIGVNSGTIGKFYQLGGPAFIQANLVIGHNAGANGAFYHTNDSLVVLGEMDLGNNGLGSYGYYQLTGGTLTNNNWLQAGRNGLGVVYLLGGGVDHIATNQGILAGNIGTGVIYITDCQVNEAGRLVLGWTANNRGEITIAGNASVTVGNTGVQFNQGTTGTCFNVLNLNGGVLVASNMYKQVAGGYSVVNFNGGKLRARGSQVLLGAGAGGVGALDAANVWPGGALIDSSNLVVSIAQPLRAPTGNGVTALPAIGTIGGYIGAPHVSITGGGGTGATAVALFDYVSGSVTGLLITSPGTDYTSGPTVTLIDGGTTNNTIGTATIGANVSGGLIKLGSGLLNLNGTNTYTGSTDVSAGNLFGTGSVAGAVTVAAGASVGPGSFGTAVGTFTIGGSLTVSNGGGVSAYLRGTNPTIRVGGDFNIGTNCVLDLVSVSALSNGTYVLVDYTGAFNGSVSGFSGLFPSGSYITNNLTTTTIDLIVTNAGGGIKWNGLVDANWQNGGPANWLTLADSNATVFTLLDSVLFDDTALANFTVNVAEVVSPGSILVNNTNQNYVFGGAGLISGNGTLTKSGPGALALASANGFTGGTVLNAGTLKLSSTGALGAAGRVLTLNGGTLQLANDASVAAYSNAIGGSVTVLLDRATSGSGITNVLGGFAFTNSATLSVQAGTNVSGGTSTLVLNGFPQFGAVLGRTATFDVGQNVVVSLPGSLTAVNSSGSLVKDGAGSLILGGGNNYWDSANGNPVLLRQGTLDLRNAQAFGDGTGTTFVYPLVAYSNTSLRLTLDANTTFLGYGTNVINGDNASLVVDRLTPGAGVVHTLNVLAFRSNFTYSAMAGANVTNGNAGVNFGATTLSGDATINVVNPVSGGGTMTMTISNSVVQASVGRSITKNGNGILTLSPANPCTYSGGTVVNEGTLVLGFANTSSNFGTITGSLLVNSGATVRSTTEKAFGFANAASGNVTTITLNNALLDHAGVNGHGGGQTVFMTASEIRSNGGVPSTNQNSSFRFSGSGTNPTIYVLASASTSLISGRVALDATGRFDVQDGAADADLLVTALITDGIGLGNPPNGIVKAGAGVMVLTSSNTYSQTTVVSNGTLLVGGYCHTGAVSVLAGATLGGTGLLGGAVTSAGTVAPGASAGILTLVQTYSQSAGATLAMEIGGLTPGTGGHDALTIGGSASLSGSLTVGLTNGFVPAAGNSFTILTASAVSGTFSTTNLPALGGGNQWLVQYGSASVVLSVTNAASPTGYDLAATVITNGLTGYQQDADGDGYANLLEYVTGGSLTNAGVEAKMQGARTNGVLALRFSRDTNAVDATIVVEGSGSAANGATWLGIATNIGGSWGAATNVVSAGTNSPLSETVYDTDGGTNRFLRLRVTRP